MHIKTHLLAASCLLCVSTATVPAWGAPAIRTCQLVDVAVFDNRVHVHCQTAGATAQDADRLRALAAATNGGGAGSPPAIGGGLGAGIGGGIGGPAPGAGTTGTGIAEPAGAGQAAPNNRFAGPPYYAVEADSAMASRIADLGAWALVNGRTVDIFYDDDPRANPPGCLQGDCRRLTGMAMR